MELRKKNNGLRTQVTCTLKRSKHIVGKMRPESEPATSIYERAGPALENMDQEVGLRCDFSLFASTEAQGAMSGTKTHLPTIDRSTDDDKGTDSRKLEDVRYHDVSTHASKSIAKRNHGVGAMHEMQNSIWAHLKSGVYGEFVSQLYLNEQFGDVNMRTSALVEESHGGIDSYNYWHLENGMNLSIFNPSPHIHGTEDGMQTTIAGKDNDYDLAIGNTMGQEYSLPSTEETTHLQNITEDTEGGLEASQETKAEWASENKRPQWQSLEPYNPKAFKRMKKLGTGLLGTVYKAKERVSGNRMTIALKVQKKTDIAIADMNEQISREMRLHRILDHPNVVELYGSFEDTANIYLAMEFMSGGDLFDKQRKKRSGRFEEPEASRYISDIALGLQYCHSKGVIHRDIKPENLLLDDSGKVKLADFGWSTDEEESREYCGTLDYMSREIITESPYGADVDCFSLGICAFEFLTGHPAFEKEGEREGEYKKKTMERIVGGKYEWPENLHISKDAKHLVDGLLRPEVKDRFTMEDVLNHRWIRKHAVETS